MATTTTNHAPRVWVGCMTHLAAGHHLVGEWFDATDAPEVTLADVHQGSGRGYAACEELWCLDHENIPVRHEMGLQEAAEWGRVYEQAGTEQWPAIYAWVCSGSYVAEGVGDLPSITDFEHAYQGRWDSFREYAEQLADDVGLLSEIPEEIARYFDWAGWTRDLAYDHTVMDAPDGGVFICRDL